MRQKSTAQKMWEHGRKELCIGILDQGKPIPKNRVKFTLHVGCKRRKDPQVCLWVVPCENEQSRSVTVKGELIIKEGCSQHLWLVEYCQCSLCVCVKVFDSRTNRELGTADSKFTIEHKGVNYENSGSNHEHSRSNQDHQTSIVLRNVLDHEIFLYNTSIAAYTFKADVQLMEHQVTLGPTPRYVCRERVLKHREYRNRYVDIIAQDEDTGDDNDNHNNENHDNGNHDNEDQVT